MNDIMPILGPLLALLKSRKAQVAIVTAIVSVVVAYVPALESVQVELIAALSAIASVLIGAIAFEDAARK